MTCPVCAYRATAYGIPVPPVCDHGDTWERAQ